MGVIDKDEVKNARPIGENDEMGVEWAEAKARTPKIAECQEKGKQKCKGCNDVGKGRLGHRDTTFQDIKK